MATNHLSLRNFSGSIPFILYRSQSGKRHNDDIHLPSGGCHWYLDLQFAIPAKTAPCIVLDQENNTKRSNTSSLSEVCLLTDSGENGLGYIQTHKDAYYTELHTVG